MIVYSKPAVKFTVVGFGQAGNRIADRYASVRNADNSYVYNCYAINSNDGDLMDLKEIKKDNRISLKLGGLGKNPEKAVQIIEDNETVLNTLTETIKNLVIEDNIVLFTAGFGGGTGTSLTVKALKIFNDIHNRPLIQKEYDKIKQQTPVADFEKNKAKYQKLAFARAQESFKKVGVLVTLPVRSDGPDVLRQVNKFANELREVSLKATNSICFTIWADNQFFYDTWIENKATSTFENYRDFANEQLFSHLNELNFAANEGGSDVVLDSQDFRRILWERTGSLVINKINVKSTNSNEVKKTIVDSILESTLHDKIALSTKNKETQETEYYTVYHMGFLVRLDFKNQALGSSFLDEAQQEISNNLLLEGSIFRGKLVNKNNFQDSVYTFYKTDAIPTRLEKGLVEEFNEYNQRRKSTVFKKASMAVIEQDENDLFGDIDLGELGLEDEEVAATSDQELIDLKEKSLNDIDVTELNLD